MGQERRHFLIATGALLAAPLARAQQPRTIGFLDPGLSPSGSAHYWQRRLPEELRKYGFQVGKNLVIEWRFADGKAERLFALAEELVRLKVELIVANWYEATVAAKRATRTIPIVMSAGHAVELGLADSYARPGGNVTGVDWWTTEFSDKLFQLLKDAAPGAKRAVRLINPNEPFARLYGDEHLRRVTSTTGLTLVTVEMTKAEDFENVLDRIAASGAEVLYVEHNRVIIPHYYAISAFAIKRKLVTLGSGGSFVDAGGLLYFGPEGHHTIGRVISYIDRILRGAKPADLPIEVPSTFELALNMKTARAIGVTLPPAFMVRVNRLIE